MNVGPLRAGGACRTSAIGIAPCDAIALCISGDIGPGETGGSRLSDATVYTCLGKRVIPGRGGEYPGRVTDLSASVEGSIAFDCALPVRFSPGAPAFANSGVEIF